MCLCSMYQMYIGIMGSYNKVETLTECCPEIRGGK